MSRFLILFVFIFASVAIQYHTVSSNSRRQEQPLTLQPLQRLGWGYVQDAAWFQDNTHFAVATGGGVWFYDANDPELAPTFFDTKGHVITDIDLSHDGALLATGGQDDDIRIWDISTGQVVQSFASGNFVNGISFSPDGTKLAASTQIEGILIFDVVSGQVLHHYDEWPWYYDIQFWDDNTLLVDRNYDCCGDLSLMDIETGERTFLRDTGQFNEIVVKDGILYVGTNLRGNGQIDMTTDPPTEIEAIDEAFFERYELTYTSWGERERWISPDASRWIIVDRADYTLNVEDIESGTIIARRDNLVITEPMAIFSPDGTTVATIVQHNRIGLWDIGQKEWVQFLDGQAAEVTDMYFTDEAILYSASRDGMVLEWNLQSGNSRTVVKFEERDILSILPGSENEILVSTCTRGFPLDERSGGIHRIDVRTGQPLILENFLEEVQQVIFEDKCFDAALYRLDNWAIFTDDSNLYRLNLVNFPELQAIPLPQSTANRGLSTTWNVSDGQLISFGGYGVVENWDLNLSRSSILAVHERQVTAAALYLDQTISAACGKFVDHVGPGGPSEDCVGAELILTDYYAEQPSQQRQQLFAHSAPIRDIQVSSQGIVATASEDGTLILWGFEE